MSISKKRGERPVPHVANLDWRGLCPCGCGEYKILLTDTNEKPLALLGFSRESLIDFTRGALSLMDKGNLSGMPCAEHTTH